MGTDLPATRGKTARVVLDVMGADRGQEAIIDGGIDAVRKWGDDLHVVFVGDSDSINSILNGKQDLPKNVSVAHADRVVPMKTGATEGVRMRDSSISVGIRLVRDGKADAFVSPGNTGAVMATSLLTLGRIKGVSRPAITSTFPTSTSRPCVVLDVGANVDCKPQHLQQFAVMGSVYASILLNLEAPRVGLLSIGEERSKGNELIFNAQKALRESKINFYGNVEGRDIMSGAVDVAVTDGFTGNILLKFAESIQPLLIRQTQRQIQTNLFSRIGAILLLPFLRRMKQQFDYAKYGGAPLLGVNGVVIICHGSSSPRAISNALSVAHEMVAKGITERIHDELVTNHFGQENGTKAKSQDNRNGVVRPAKATDQR